jgi:hypothetical protein
MTCVIDKVSRFVIPYTDNLLSAPDLVTLLFNDNLSVSDCIGFSDRII